MAALNVKVCYRAGGLELRSQDWLYRLSCDARASLKHASREIWCRRSSVAAGKTVHTDVTGCRWKCDFIWERRVSICRSIMDDPAGVCISRVLPLSVYRLVCPPRFENSVQSDVSKRGIPLFPVARRPCISSIAVQEQTPCIKTRGRGIIPLFKWIFIQLWNFWNLEQAVRVRVRAAYEDVLI